MEPDQPALAAEAQALVARRALVAAVLPSVVSVDWTWTTTRDTFNAVSAGSVLHKSVNHTYILTFPPLDIRGHIVALVHFHDQVEINAGILFKTQDNDSSRFAVLRTHERHESSESIQFNEELIQFSNALCVVPKTKSDFHKIQGFIPRPTCAAHVAKSLPEKTNDYFVFVCQHRDTEIMKSAPVFHENSRVNGFVIQDCSTPPEPLDKPGAEFIDREAKICVKQRHLEAWLRKLTGVDDWRAGLV